MNGYPDTGPSRTTVSGVTTTKGLRQPAHSHRKRYPEQAIEGAEPRTRPLGMHSQQLLSQRQIL
jgi:hypothetical protein